MEKKEENGKKKWKKRGWKTGKVEEGGGRVRWKEEEG